MFCRCRCRFDILLLVPEIVTLDSSFGMLHAICLKNHRSQPRNQALRGQGNPDQKVTLGSLTLAIWGIILVVNVPLAVRTNVAVGDKCLPGSRRFPAASKRTG